MCVRKGRVGHRLGDLSWNCPQQVPNSGQTRNCRMKRDLLPLRSGCLATACEPNKDPAPRPSQNSGSRSRGALLTLSQNDVFNGPLCIEPSNPSALSFSFAPTRISFVRSSFPEVPAVGRRWIGMQCGTRPIGRTALRTGWVLLTTSRPATSR